MKRKMVQKNNKWKWKYFLETEEKLSIALCIMVVLYVAGRCWLSIVTGV